MSRTHRLFTLLLVAVVALVAACERTPEDVEKWRDAKGGMEKMQQWVASAEEPMPVRKRALTVLVEEGEGNLIQPALEEVGDEKVRQELVASVVPTVVALWEEQDVPELTPQMVEEGAQVKVSDAAAVVRAKDAAYFLQPYATGEDKAKLESILAQWVSRDWQLRNDLGKTTVGQIAPRAGDKGIEGLVAWAKQAKFPDVVAELVKQHGGEAGQSKVAVALRERAEENYDEFIDPNVEGGVTAQLRVAILQIDHEEMVPFLKKLVVEEKASGALRQGAVEAIKRTLDERATPYFTQLVTERKGMLRWVAAQTLIDLRGKPGLLTVASALPLETEAYPPVDDKAFQQDSRFICNHLKNVMEEQGVADVSDVVGRALEKERWPVQVIGLQCASVFQTTDLKPKVEALTDDDTPVPGWGEETTVGEIAQKALKDLETAAAAK